MRKRDQTTLGGLDGSFHTTQWSEVYAAAALDPSQQQAGTDALVRRYWKPVYCYLRRKGNDNEQAKDLTQGFFHEIVLGRDLIQQADAGKGRFRTFLLTALDRYTTSVHRRENAAKRRPQGPVVPVDDMDDRSISVAAEIMEPHDAFTYVWACELLHEVLSEVEVRCIREDKSVHWQLFHAHIVKPLLTGEESTSLAELAARLGIPDRIRAENMIVTVRRRFQTVLRNRMREYVSSDEQVDQEIRDLMQIFSR